MSTYLNIYITTLSRYFLGIFLILYCVLGITLLIRDDPDYDNSVLLHAQSVCMFLFSFTAFLCISSVTGDTRIMLYFFIEQVLMIGIIVIGSILYPDANRLFGNNMCMLLSVGFVILTRLNVNKSLKQLLIVTVSFIVSMGVPLIIRRIRLLYTLKWIYASIGIGALGAVLIAGQITYGANISYTIGGITFQPSEIIKIVFVFFVASCFVRARGLNEVLISASIAVVHVLILVLSRDLGSALIYGVVYLVMVFVATGNILYLLGGGAAAFAAALVAYQRFAHVRTRVQAWLDPWSTIDDTGYQITQSLFAISSGSTWGLGLMKGNPASIPFVEDDFVFSAVVEEMGFVVGISLLVICLLSFLASIRLAAALSSMYYRLLAVGLGTSYIFQVFVTVGGGVKFIPLTGVTLPFVSYGGSSVLTSILLFEVLMGVSMIRMDEEIFYEKINEHNEGTRDKSIQS
ncbi:MAG: FtsW/RodA/SpoVE family cell cycle protein [Lachnospiraceae bacterium]|nr:FtsW/RodA/SpoVE family cell cycle protein [Lachnospiraceae bacterium]